MSKRTPAPDAQLDEAPTPDELAPPAPAEAQAPAPEEEGAARSTAPSSEDDVVDEELDLDEDAPTRHPSSAGFGIVGKFEGARADRERQGAGYHDRWQDAREANGEPRTAEAGYTEDRDQ